MVHGLVRRASFVPLGPRLVFSFMTRSQSVLAELDSSHAPPWIARLVAADWAKEHAFTP
jgi:hypothetical protein